ncbi:MAG: hypothetical protein WB780_23140 [Candidatus Acidiferrales bacterium]
MSKRRVVPTMFVAMAALSVVILLCPAGFAQQQPATQPGVVPDAKQVLGYEDVKPNKKGTLSVANGTLEFKRGKKTTDLKVTSISDVITDKDSQRTIGGVVGTISMFGPYGSGRFLSLFRTKIDTLTIQYHDASGGLHGAIFALPEGRAEDFKKELLAEGAKTTIPIEAAPATPKAEEPKQ